MTFVPPHDHGDRETARAKLATLLDDRVCIRLNATARRTEHWFWREHPPPDRSVRT